jgi:hypothetical protein
LDRNLQVQCQLDDKERKKMLPTSKGRETSRRATGSPADPKLSPKLERAREKTLSALGRLSLSDALVQLKTVFESQKTEEGRLSNLSAQTWILRRRLEALQKGQPGPDVQSFLQANPEGSQKLKLLALRSLQPVADPSAPAKDDSVAVETLDTAQKSWQRVRIVAEAEVNGMVFFEGSMIAVKVEDAGRLVAAGKAEIVEEPSTHEPPPPASAVGAKKPRSEQKPGGTANDKKARPQK